MCAPSSKRVPPCLVVLLGPSLVVLALLFLLLHARLLLLHVAVLAILGLVRAVLLVLRLSPGVLVLAVQLVLGVVDVRPSAAAAAGGAPAASAAAAAARLPGVTGPLAPRAVLLLLLVGAGAPGTVGPFFLIWRAFCHFTSHHSNSNVSLWLF